MCRLSQLSTLLVAVLLIGCASDHRPTAKHSGVLGRSKQVARSGKAPPKDNVSYWNGDAASGSPRIKIDLGEQRAYFYKGGDLVGVSQVSTGRDGYRTPSGSYSVQSKDADHYSSLYGSFVDGSGNVVMSDVGVRTHSRPPGTRFSGASMPYFIRFNGGIGMHAGYLPGYPASHGCVRLPREMANHFYNNVHAGTPVIVMN